jgi:hypothetical protein
MCNSKDKCRNVGDFGCEDTEPAILCKDMGDLRVGHRRDNDICTGAIYIPFGPPLHAAAIIQLNLYL